MINRNIILAATALVVSLASPMMTTLSAQDVQHVDVTASKFKFSPAEATVKVGQPVEIDLKSADVAHGLRLSDFNASAKAAKGETAKLTFTPDKTGDFTGHCSVFCGSGHGSMTFVLHVVK